MPRSRTPAPAPTAVAALGVAERLLLRARDATDGHAIATARGRSVATAWQDPDRIVREAAAAHGAVDGGALAGEDLRAWRTIGWALAGLRRSIVGDADPVDVLIALTRRLDAAYSAASEQLRLDGERVGRLTLLGRLADEEDPAARRRAFEALAPLWRVVDGNDPTGPERSPYRQLIRVSAEAWRSGRSPVVRNETALGLPAGTVERWCRKILGAWQRAFVRAGTPLVEPWDWWWVTGEAERLLAPVLPVDRVIAVATAWCRALGAEPEHLGIRLNVVPRRSRPPVPVAYTTFGRRARRRRDGRWSPGRTWVFATYEAGGLGELTELVHELGHAMHISAIRTRPAFADWPDADAFTEGIAELPALDTAEPAWQRAWLGDDAPDVPLAAALRERFASIALDAAWALFEIELHRDPDLLPNEVWSAICERWLGVAGHPEWSWWAIRGQLVESPGYLANYPVGAVLAADIRASIRAARGDWTHGDPGWHAWVTERVYRFGLERPAGQVVRDVLGRSPEADALVALVARAA